MKTLVAGIGNIFNRDDGFGVEVAQALLGRPMPDDVHVEDYGIRGLHLALELLEGYDLLILVDAVAAADEAPGTVLLLEPDDDLRDAAALDAHSMDPHAVLARVADMGGSIGRVLIVGCRPVDLGEGIGLSPAVAAAVEPAVAMVEDLLAERMCPCSVASSS